MNIVVRQAHREDAARVADLVHALLCELSPPGVQGPPVDTIRASSSKLIGREDSGVWAFIAESKSGVGMGVLTLNESASIYAGGNFGTITELYVSPAARSSGIGPKLLDAAKQFAREQQWSRLEVGAPDVPRWNRTVSFYLKSGFVEVGPRLKLLL